MLSVCVGLPAQGLGNRLPRAGVTQVGEPITQVLDDQLGFWTRKAAPAAAMTGARSYVVGYIQLLVLLSQ